MPTPSPTPPPATIDQWTLVLGFLMPLIVPLIIQSHWPRAWKTLVAALTCLCAATIQLALKGEFDFSNLGFSVLAILSLSITFFKGFWRPLGVAGLLEKATDLPNPRQTQSTTE